MQHTIEIDVFWCAVHVEQQRVQIALKDAPENLWLNYDDLQKWKVRRYSGSCKESISTPNLLAHSRTFDTTYEKRTRHGSHEMAEAMTKSLHTQYWRVGAAFVETNQ